MIHFVGAGSGAPDLITVRGKKYLEEADVVIYAGSLVNPKLLEYTKDICTIYNSAKMTLEEVLSVMEKAEAAGKTTVRLHTGDPCIYGAIREQMDVLDEKGITLHAGSDEVTFLYGDYNYEDIDDTDCLPAVAQFLVRHLRGYYNISRTFYTVPKHNGRSITEKPRQVFIRRHHEDSPFDPTPTQKQRLF